MGSPNLLLTNDEITIVNNLIWEKPVREVAAKIGRSLMALHYYLKHRDNYPPPKCTSPKDKEKQLLSSSSSSSSSITAIRFPNTVSSTTTTTSSSSTVRGAATKSKKIEPVTMSQYQQEERLAFANMYKTWSEAQWRRVLFHDERRFHIDGPDGYTHYFHDLRNDERILSNRPRGTPMYVWFIISYGGHIRCEISKTKFKPEDYLSFIEKDRALITERLDGNPDFWIQDHHNVFQNLSTLPQIQNRADLAGIKTQQWPSLSHDINIVENIWSFLIRDVYDTGKTYTRKDELKMMFQIAWQRLPVDMIQNLYTTLTDRIMELFYTNGCYTYC